MKDRTAGGEFIEDTGERMVPAYHKGHMVYGEHIVRYVAAREVVRGKVVLDIASGSGYGTSELAKSAEKVIGVDLNKEAIKYAKKNYGAKNVDFINGKATEIPLKSNSVDVVVSFETIEHINDYQKFMQEITRVLKQDGLLILSTPNDVEFPEGNHFHVHEFKYEELQKLAKKYFENVENYFQATWLYNALLREDQLSKEWVKEVETLQTAPVDKKKATYFYMLCSNRDITESLSSVSAISEHWSAKQAQDYESSIREHIEDQGKIIVHLKNSLDSEKNKNLEAIDIINKLKEEIEVIRNSVISKVKRTIKQKIIHARKRRQR